MPFGLPTWVTPVCAIKNKEEVWAKLEKRSWQPPKIDTTKEITYFNNTYKYKWKPYYDHFFAYTKVHPLWDQRKHRENAPYLPDIWCNIYEQEQPKPVPALTSQIYGRIEPYDYQETGYRRITATTDFYRKRGVMRVQERKEKPKPVPALTSQIYGRIEPYDYQDTGYRRITATTDFYRKKGVMQEQPKPVLALTSQIYGCIEPYDYQETGYRRITDTTDFHRKRGVMRVQERKVI